MLITDILEPDQFYQLPVLSFIFLSFTSGFEKIT